MTTLKLKTTVLELLIHDTDMHSGAGNELFFSCATPTADTHLLDCGATELFFPCSEPIKAWAKIKSDFKSHTKSDQSNRF